MQQVCVCAGGYQTAYQAVLEHVAASAGIFTNDNPGRTVTAIAPAQLGVIPAQKPAHLESMIGGQITVGFSPEAVSSKILSHRDALLSHTKRMENPEEFTSWQQPRRRFSRYCPPEPCHGRRKWGRCWYVCRLRYRD